MSSLKTNVQESKPVFKGKFVRNILGRLWILSIVFILLMAAFTYAFSRRLLYTQAINQIQTIANKELGFVQNISQNSLELMKQWMGRAEFSRNVEIILTSPPNSSQSVNAQDRLNKYYQAIRPSQLGKVVISQLLLVNQSGDVIFSSEPQWQGLNISKDTALKALLGNDGITGIYNPGGIFPGAFYSVSHLTVQSGSKSATLIGLSDPLLMMDTLKTVGVFNINATTSFATADGLQILVDPSGNKLTSQPTPEGLMSRISPVFTSQKSLHTNYRPESGMPVIISATYLPELNTALIVELPQNIVYQQSSSLLILTGIIIALSILVFGAFILILARSIVPQLNTLTKSIQRFSIGEWNQKIPVETNDEFGLVAHSFNQMADELSGLYHSLESQVADRTRHLRTASEVAHIATTTPQLSDILKKTVDLLVERFGFNHAAIYLLNEAGTEAILREATGELGRRLQSQKYRIAVGSPSIIGLSATHNQTRVVTDLGESSELLRDDLHPASHSEAAIPITINNQLFGILNVQSTHNLTFTAEIIGVLQTLTSQIATAIQNARTLESTQVNLQETTLLYRASRQVAQASSPEEVYNVVIESLRSMNYGSALLLPEEGQLRILHIIDTHRQEPSYFSSGLALPYSAYELHISKSNPTIIDDFSNTTAKISPIFSLVRSLDCQSAALIPILKNKELAGVIVLAAQERHYFTNTYLQPFATLTEMISSTLERLDALQGLQKKLVELQTINNINNIMSVEVDLFNLYSVIHKEITKVMGNVDFLIAIYDAKTNHIRIPYIYEGSEALSLDPFPLGEGLTSLLIKTKKPLLLDHDTTEQAIAMGAKVIGKPAQSWLGVPLMVAGDVVGAVIVQDVEHEYRFNQDDVNLLTTLAPQIAISVRNAQLLHEMELALQAYDQERYLLNTLLRNIPDQIYFKSRDSRYIRVSDSYAARFNVDEAVKLVGKSDFDLMEEEKALRIYEEEQNILQSGQPIMGEVVYESVGNKWLLTSKIPLTETTDQSFGILGISRDISELIEQQQSSLQRAVQLQTAAEIAREISGTLDMELLFQNVARKIYDRFGYSHVSIYRWDPIYEKATLQAAVGEADERLIAENQPIDASFRTLVGRTIRDHQTITVNNTLRDPHYYPNPLLPGTKSELSIPLSVGDRFLGVLDIHSKEEDAFSSVDISILRIISDQLSVTIVNAELFATTQTHLAQHRLLHQITSAASASSNVNEALTSAIEGLRMTLPGMRIAFLMLNDDHTGLELRAYAGYSDDEVKNIFIPIGEGVTGWVLHNRQSLRVDNTRTDVRYIAVSEDVLSELAVPILFHDEIMGVLNLESDRLAAFDENDQEIMSTLAGSIGAILANARLVEQIRQQVDRQRQLYEITSRIRRSTNIETILETSASEIARVMGARKTKVEVTINQQQTSQTTTPAIGGNGKGKV